MQRREFLVSAAMVPGLALVPGVAGAVASSSPSGATAATAAAGLAASLRPAPASIGALGTDATLLGGFRVVQAYEQFHGAMPFVLEGEGGRFQLDVLRRTEAGEGGVHRTEHFAFFAHGTCGPTQERGARALGLVLEQHIRDGAPLPAIASFEERRDTAGAALFDVDFERTSADPAPGAPTPSV